MWSGRTGVARWSGRRYWMAPRTTGSRLAVVLAALSLTVACATGRGSVGGPTVTVDELLGGVVLGVERAEVEVVDAEEVLALSPEMEVFLARRVDRSGSSHSRLRQLATAIVRERTFGLDYDDRTRTAAETFRDRRGNCMSFSNMFIAMARHIGLDASFQEVDIPPDWSLEEHAYVLNRHVNVHIDLGWGADQVIDFAIDDFRSSYDHRVISDGRALAHFYNNIGVEHMQAGDTAAALVCFGRAVGEHDRRFSPAWVNLGTLYLRHDHLAHAEAAYLQALRADRFDLVALSNLANLYESRGDGEWAEHYRQRVRTHRMRNPYYRFHLAHRAYLAGDYPAAVDHLRYAVRSRKGEGRFCFLLGLVYLRMGQEEVAERWLARARELAASDDLRRHYSHKFEALRSGQLP